MIVKTDPALVPVLSDYLTSRLDLVVERVGSDRLAVSFLESRRPATERRELEQRLRAWRPYRRDVRAELLGVMRPPRPASARAESPVRGILNVGRKSDTDPVRHDIPRRNHLLRLSKRDYTTSLRYDALRGGS